MARVVAFFASVVIVVVAIQWWRSPAPRAATTESGKGVSMASIGPLTFGPDGTLFAADTEDASIVAFDTRSASGSENGAKAIEAVDEKLAALLGTWTGSITITDLAVHPRTHNVYIAVQRGLLGTPALVRVDGGGALEAVALDSLDYLKTSLSDAPAGFMQRGPRSEVITDMAAVNERLVVAGLSNEEFASKLRSIPYPFRAVDRGTSVEMFHGSHGGWETRAPINTFMPYVVGGKTYLVAGYLCTPLVLVPFDDLAPGSRVRGTTIAELGAGNRPLDMVAYQKDGKAFLLMSTTDRGVMKISTESFASAKPITVQVRGREDAGVKYDTVSAWTNVEQLDLLDSEHAVLVTRTDGRADLRIESLP